MDKNEYRAKLDQINDLVDRQDYKGALQIVDTIDWRRVRSARTLCMVGEIYEANKRYEESRKLLLLAHQRAPIGRTVLYRLVELSIKMGNFDEALDYYKQFVELSPNDNSRYILKYKIYKAKRAPIEEQISILQEYKSREYTERWAYELARLYAKAGMKDASVEECDDLILWFSEGKYVTKAMELKMKFTPLSASQQEKYNSKFGVKAAEAKMTSKLSKAKKEEKPSVPQAEDTAARDKEIEEILKSIPLNADTIQIPVEEVKKQAEKQEPVTVPEELPVYTPKLEDPQNLPNKVAQGLRDVFQGKDTDVQAEEETAASKEPSSKEGEREYVVKELEPEEIHKPAGFKPFHAGGAMTMEVKAEVPKAQMFRAEDSKPGAFKTNAKDIEIDLEALLAETANELAQAVAEETRTASEPEALEAESSEEAISETKGAELSDTKLSEAEDKEVASETEAEEESADDKEAISETEAEEESADDKEVISGTEAEEERADEPEAVSETQAGNAKDREEAAQAETLATDSVETETAAIPAPAAAKASMIAANLSAAFAAKAEELDVLVSDRNQQGEAEEIVETEDTAKSALIEEPTEKTEPAEAKETVEAAEFAEAEEPAGAADSAEAAAFSQTEESGESMESAEALEIPNISDTVSAEDIIAADEIIEAAESIEGAPVKEAEIEIPKGATREFPVEEVKQAVQEIDLSEVLERELGDTLSPQQEDSHIKRVTASVAAEGRKSMAFNTAVEGVMRHHLTEEEHRRLFTYFAPIPGMTEQINEALDTAQESACARTSQAGNIIVTGREGSGKTRLSEGLVKALCKERQMEGAKVAYITAEQLNRKDPVAVVGKLAGGFLVVEHAGEMVSGVVENMSKAMEFKTNRLTVILEDLKPGIRKLEEQYPEFMAKFDSRITIPVFTNDELVSFAKTYAKELGYKIDDMAVLALYTLIGDNQNEENPVAIGMVREMMDEAIKKASKKGRRAGKKVSKRHLDETGRIMLYEKDFDI